jgi:hypothetical protein
MESDTNRGFGYIYILASSAHRDLVKIGKTKRDPQERANELSSATGVPVPFILIWHEAVGDVDAAESFVHLELESIGARPSGKREFFNLTPNDAVRRLQGMTLPDKFPVLQTSDIALPIEVSDLPPGLSAHTKALSYAYGIGGEMKNEVTAEKYFKLAVSLNWLPTYRAFSSFYGSKNSLLYSRRRAFQFALAGAEKGDPQCIQQIAELYAQDANETEFKLYSQEYFDFFCKPDMHETATYLADKYMLNLFDDLGNHIFYYLTTCLFNGWTIDGHAVFIALFDQTMKYSYEVEELVGPKVIFEHARRFCSRGGTCTSNIHSLVVANARGNLERPHRHSGRPRPHSQHPPRHSSKNFNRFPERQKLAKRS